MKRFKRGFLWLQLGLFLFLSPMGCSLSETKKTGDAATVDLKNQLSNPIKLKVGYGYDSTVSWKEGEGPTNNDWTKLYAESGYQLETLFSVDEKDLDQKMAVAISSGEYPDVFRVSGTELVRYANSGVITDITEAYETYASPELKEYMETEGGRYLDSARVKGKLYGLPKINWPWSDTMMLFIRQDWLDSLGLSVPTTIEELKKVAQAFTFEDPDGNGKHDTYGLVLNGKDDFSAWSGIQAFFECYGLAPGHWSGNFPFLEEDGLVQWGGMDAKTMKKALTDLNEMYQAGTLSKQFATLDSDSLLTEVIEGNAGIYFAPYWGAMNAQVEAYKKDQKAVFKAYRLPDGAGFLSAKPYMNNTPTHFSVVSSQFEKPEELVKLANLAVQKLIYPENEADLKYDDNYKYGEEKGIGWKGALTQFRKIAIDFDNDRAVRSLLKGQKVNTTATQESLYSEIQSYLQADLTSTLKRKIFANDPDVTEGFANWTVWGEQGGMTVQHDIYYRYRMTNNQIYVTTPTETMANRYMILNPITQETLIKIITGANSVDSYDHFLENWKKIGGDAVTKEAQDWYDQLINKK